MPAPKLSEGFIIILLALFFRSTIPNNGGRFINEGIGGWECTVPLPWPSGGRTPRDTCLKLFWPIKGLTVVMGGNGWKVRGAALSPIPPYDFEWCRVWLTRFRVVDFAGWWWYWEKWEWPYPSDGIPRDRLDEDVKEWRVLLRWGFWDIG